jgi:hypothetical protein
LLLNPEPTVRFGAALKLETLSESIPRLLPTFEKFLKKHSGSPILGSAIDALWEIYN